jgi:hypothetical protein
MPEDLIRSLEAVERKRLRIEADERMSEIIFHHVGLLNAVRSCQGLTNDLKAAIETHAKDSLKYIMEKSE